MPLTVCENGGRTAEVVVRPQLLGAIGVGAVGRLATGHESVTRELLVMPHHLAVFHPKGQDGIAGGRRDPSEAVARSDVDQAALGIHRGRVPHRSARRPPTLLPIRVFAERAQRLRDTLRNPQHLARVGVERCHGPAGLAALIVEIRPDQRLGAGHRHIKPSVMIGSRSAQVIQSGAHLRFPEQFAVMRIESVSSSRAGDEEDRVAGSGIPGDRCGDGSEPAKHIGLVSPVKAARLGVQRIDDAVVISHEDSAERHRRLRIHAHAAGKSKGPLELQLGYIGCRETGGVFRLKAGVARSSPARPNGRSVQIGKIGIRRASVHQFLQNALRYSGRRLRELRAAKSR